MENTDGHSISVLQRLVFCMAVQVEHHQKQFVSTSSTTGSVQSKAIRFVELSVLTFLSEGHSGAPL